ncbi:MAG: radical SAM protein [Firmicutes bacterium]|nr:radical SAM protein [Bacillota bacterium]
MDMKAEIASAIDSGKFTITDAYLPFTTACPKKCKHCYLDPKKPEHINDGVMDKFFKFLGQAKHVKTLHIDGGEPTMNKHAPQQLEHWIKHHNVSVRRIGLVTSDSNLNNDTFYEPLNRLGALISVSKNIYLLKSIDPEMEALDYSIMVNKAVNAAKSRYRNIGFAEKQFYTGEGQLLYPKGRALTMEGAEYYDWKTLVRENPSLGFSRDFFEINLEAISVTTRGHILKPGIWSETEQRDPENYFGDKSILETDMKEMVKEHGWDTRQLSY